MRRAVGTVLFVASVALAGACAHTPSRADAYRQECEDQEAAKSCVELGRLYVEGRGVEQDPDRARELFERACNAGYAKGCVDLGVMYEGGEGVPQHWGRAADLFRRACDRGAPAGCNDLGNLYAKGQGMDRDPVRASELYQKACESGIAAGCYNAANIGSVAPTTTGDVADGGSLMATPVDAGALTTTVTSFASVYVNGKPVTLSSGAPLDANVKRMEQLAMQMSALAQQLCKDKSAGCYRIDRTVTVPGGVTMFVNGQQVDGEGAQVALGRVRARLQRECDGGNAAECYALSVMYEAGNGAPKDGELAAQLRQRACKGGIQLACGSSP